MRRWGPDSEAVAKVATLVRASPRVVIALGAKAALCDGASFARLARLAHAPILYRLDAKGLVDEHDPLAFGVVGVHGKPGLEHAAALVATAELVLAFGVEDHSLLLCNNQCPYLDLTPLACGSLTARLGQPARTRRRREMTLRHPDSLIDAHRQQRGLPDPQDG